MDAILDRGYTVRQKIAAGGEGRIYLCEKDGEVYVLKVIMRIGIAQQDTIERIGGLGSPYFPHIHTIIHDDNNTYIIREYIEGNTLKEELDRNGSLSFPRAREIFFALCEAVRILHHAKPEPIIYRDMKPDNIIITPDGEVRIIDFGIARIHKANADRDTCLAGTYGYTAPEVMGGFQSDERSDVYSLGVILYEMLSGRRIEESPYQIRPLVENAPYLPTGLDKIIAKATDQKQICRYAGVDDLMRAVEEVDMPVRRRKLKWAYFTLGAVCICCVFFVLLYQSMGGAFTKDAPVREIEAASTLRPKETGEYVGRDIDIVCREMADQNFYPAVYGLVSDGYASGEIISHHLDDTVGMVVDICIGPPVAEVIFGDEALAGVVRSALGIGKDAPVSSGDMAALTTFDIAGRSIGDLTGLEYAVNLTHLYMDDNCVTDLGPLRNLGRLEMLTLSDNTVAYITPVIRLRNIKVLYFENNRISDISALDGIDYYDLKMGGNRIYDIGPLYRSQNIVSLDLHDNPVADISLLPDFTMLESLDISGLPVSDYTPLLDCWALEAVNLGSPAADIDDLVNTLKNRRISVRLEE